MYCTKGQSQNKMVKPGCVNSASVTTLLRCANGPDFTAVVKCEDECWRLGGFVDDGADDDAAARADERFDDGCSEVE